MSKANHTMLDPLLKIVVEAIQAARLLAEFHGHGRVHGGLRPSLFVRNASGGISSLLPPPPESAISTDPVFQFRYVSPEQAGRLTDKTSIRSDLYSFGIILYEWFAGVPPFVSSDPLELVHCQLAIAPVPPIVHRPDLLPVLSDIILRLLAKHPDHRYASAAGLLHDLAAAQQLLQSPALHPAAFVLGSHDAATQFVLQDKLYGRDEEKARLMSLYRQAAGGTGSLCLISGYSGIGKTALAQTLRQPVQASGGHMAAGKYDQFHRQIPYSAFLDMFQVLIRQVLGGSESEIAAWKQRYLTVTGDNAMVAATLLPDLARILGPQPDPMPLSGAAAEHRFKEVFAKLFQLFVDPGKPLVVFLDDLQWADFASLSLVQHLLTAGDAAHALIIGAYRDNEVDAAHPLHLMVAELRKKNIPVAELAVVPLRADHIADMLEDACAGGLRRCHDFVQIVMEKTGGNPFYTRQFLNEIYRNGFIFHVPAIHRWDWNASAVIAAGRSENVIDLLSRRMAKLPPASRQLIRYAACAGQEFDLELLATTLHLTSAEALGCLAPVLHDELIQPVRSSNAMIFRFIHDRVQQAAHALPGEPIPAAIHLAFARMFLASIQRNAFDEQIFIIADHLNHGIALVKDDVDRWTYARLNLRAGLKAKDALAYQAASSYFNSGLAFLPKNAWEEDFRLPFDLHLHCAEIADLTNNVELFNALCAGLEAHCRTPLEHYEVCYRRIKFASHHANLMEVIEQGRRGLAKFGISIPPLDDHEALRTMFHEQLADFRAHADRLSLDELEHLPDSSDPAHNAILSLIESISESALILNADLFACIAAIGASRSIRFGNTGLSSVMYGILCIVLIAQYRSFAEVRRIAPVYLRIIRRPGVGSYEFGRCMTHHIWNVNHYIADFETVLPLIRENLTESIKSHDMLYAAYCWTVETHAHFIRGHNLDDAVNSGSSAYKMCMTNNIPLHLSFCEPITAVVHALRGDTSAIDDLSWTDFNEDAFRAAWASVPMTTAIWKIAKITACGFAGLFAKILELAPGIHDDHPRSHMLNFEWNFWLGIACAVTVRQAGGSATIQSSRAGLDEQIAYFDVIHRTGHAPNVEARLCFLQAERARCDRQTDLALASYAAAAQSAAANRFTLLEGYCHETLAAFHLELRQFDESRLAIENAIRCYRQCHASALLPRLHGKLAALGGNPAAAPDVSAINPLDAIAVVRAVQTLSAEVDPRRLLHKLLDLLVEFAGAESGCIATIHPDSIAVVETAGAPLPDLPVHLFRYALNTGSTLCPQDPAATPAIMLDPAVTLQSPLSLYCRPLGKPGATTRVIYLEHRALPGVFLSRLKIVNMMVDQASTSIEIAELYASMETKVVERTRDLEAAKMFAEAAERAAEEANRAKSNFLANMSHELRTPMNAILGFSQIMARDSAATPVQRENLGIILKSGEHLLALINDILDLAKIEAGKIDVDNQDFDLGELTGDLFTMFRLRAEAKGLRLVFDQPSLFPRFVRSDPGKLRQIIINLVGNAIKFTPKGQVSLKLSVISLNHGSDHLRLLFEIADTGPGIAPEDLDRIFHPFEQARHKHLAEGTGLGLAISREYVHLLGGSLTVDSTVGQGSTFRFSILCQPVDSGCVPVLSVPATRIESIEHAGNFRILVVEDQPDNRRLLKILLAPFGFQYREAADGREAVNAVREWQPHLILMDRRMPVLNGMDATREIRQLSLASQPIIIAVTAHAYEEERQEILAAGCDAFLSKPFRERELFDLLARHLDIRVRYAAVPEEEAIPRLVPESFAGLSAGLRRKLANALTDLDMEAVEKCLAEIQVQDPVLASQLKHETDKFAYDDILQTMNPTRESSRG